VSQRFRAKLNPAEEERGKILAKAAQIKDESELGSPLKSNKQEEDSDEMEIEPQLSSKKSKPSKDLFNSEIKHSLEK